MEHKIEVGSTVEGVVVGIKNFGAFVDLPNGICGLVHISEISEKYIINILDKLSIGQKVKVKILDHQNGKTKLSIRQADSEKSNSNLDGKRISEKEEKFVAGGKKPIAMEKNKDFETMMKKFKKYDTIIMRDLRKSMDCHRRKNKNNKKF
jgi:S1 RNA binding domain protein